MRENENKSTTRGLLTSKNNIYEGGHSSELEKFSDAVRHIVIVPIRGELHNGNLANFLSRANRQKGFTHDKLSIIFLVDDHASDRDNKALRDENHLTASYLSSLSNKNFPEIEDLDIPPRYKNLAKDILEKNMLEIRIAYLNSPDTQPHFGDLRLKLLDLANACRNPDISLQDIIIHFSDIDTTLPPDHFEKQKTAYANPTNQINISKYDFMPGKHEGNKDNDLSKNMLTHLDQYRLFRYGKDVQNKINGCLPSANPLISGRLSFFMDETNELHGTLRWLLQTQRFSEDWAIGIYLKSRLSFNKTTFAQHSSQAGEVYFLNRTRTTTHRNPGTDAEEAFNIASKKEFTGKTTEGNYNLLEESETNAYILDLESQIEHILTYSISAASPTGFKEDDRYKNILQVELQKEQAKVRLRRIRLASYIRLVASNEKLTPDEQQIFAPYAEYFPYEIASIKDLLDKGQAPKQIAQTLMQKGEYEALFNPDAPIHTQIARLRTLRRYTIAYNIDGIETLRDRMPPGSLSKLPF